MSIPYVDIKLDNRDLYFSETFSIVDSFEGHDIFVVY